MSDPYAFRDSPCRMPKEDAPSETKVFSFAKISGYPFPHRNDGTKALLTGSNSVVIPSTSKGRTVEVVNNLHDEQKRAPGDARFVVPSDQRAAKAPGEVDA